MEHEVKLPYYSRYFPGKLLKLNWLKAITSNDSISARHLNWHAHDETELIFPLRGHYRYEFKGRPSVTVRKGSFIVIPKNTLHRLHEAIDPPGGRLHLYLRNPSDRLTGATFSSGEFACLHQALSRMTLRSLPASPVLKTLIAPLGKIITRGQLPLPDADLLQLRFLCCLALCNCASGGSNEPDRSPSQTFAQAVTWLKRNYASDIHLDQLVDHIGYSRARFFDLFMQQIRMTPGEYLRNYRLEKAKEMLLQTDLPAARVGKACGLGDPAHFSRLFRKMTGYTPIAYRQKKRRPQTNCGPLPIRQSRGIT